jgi:hypothetical protein
VFARLLPALLLSGCATGWIVTEAVGGQRALDENVHEVRVPEPGIQEHLTVTLLPGSTSFACAIDQTGPERVYHQAFRYGSRWKKTVALMFVAEAVAGSLFLLTADDQHPQNYLYGGFFALDAAVSAPLFFIPRKEIYRTDDTQVTTSVRNDCPDGLAVAIGSDTFPIDATGKLGDLGTVALGEWLKAPNGTLRLTIAGQERELYVEPTKVAAVIIPVAVGSLTSAGP